MVAATVLMGMTAAVLVASQHDAESSSSGGDGSTIYPILGSWRLVAATDKHAIQVPTKPVISITFQADNTAVIWTGVNAINLTVRYAPGAITAQFHGTTAAYDGNTNPHHLAILALLDALAPMAGPAPAGRSSYRLQDDRLTIQMDTGTLAFTRDALGGEPR